MTYNIIIGRTESDRKKFGEKGTILIGRSYVKMGQTTTLSNYVYMDVIKSHVVLVVGKRGCLTGETLVFTNNGFKEIKEFHEKNDKIYSFDKEKNKWKWEKAKLLKYPIKEKLLKIETYDGQYLTLTKEHPLLVIEKNKLIWKKAEKINSKDLLINVTSVPEITKNTESLQIARILGFTLADGTLYVKKGRFKDGRGYLYNGTKSRLRIFNASEEVLNTAKKDLEKEFKITTKRYKKKDCNCEIIETKQAKVVNRLIKLGVPVGLKSHLIRIPKVVFTSSNNFKAAFIGALFSCDGYINKNGFHAAYYSKSRKFLEELNLLLLHLNIQSTIRIKKAKLKGKLFINYQLYITDHESLENLKKIDLIDKEKQRKLNLHKYHIQKRRKQGSYFSKELYLSKIRSITEISNITEVYDLNVPINHSFIANGIISHNSGKSYSSSVITEGIIDLPDEISNNLSVIMLDTMGVFWTMKYPNEKDSGLLEQWGLKAKGLEKIKIFTPIGMYEYSKSIGIPTDAPFSIKASELSGEDWRLAFELSSSHPVSILIDKILGDLADLRKEEFNVDDIINLIQKDNTFSNETKNEAINRFKASKGWGLFSNEGTKIEVLINRGAVSVLDMSAYATSSGGWGIKALVVGLISKKIFIERMLSRKLDEIESIRTGYSYFKIKEEVSEDKKPLIWFILDEAHELLPAIGKTAATDALVTILREGRQPGISLLLITQQPGKIHSDVLTQSDIVLAHRLTAKIDVEAFNSMMQSYLGDTLTSYLNILPADPGAAIVLDDNSERLYPIQVRPKVSWHGGESPTAIKFERSKNLGL